MLLQTLKKDALEARKARDSVKSTALITLIGEIETSVKAGRSTDSDEDVLVVITKFVKNINETMSVAPSAELEAERAIYIAYLPMQMTEQELSAVIMGFIANGLKGAKEIMPALKAQYNGKFDGKLASILVKHLS